MNYIYEVNFVCIRTCVSFSKQVNGTYIPTKESITHGGSIVSFEKFVFRKAQKVFLTSQLEWYFYFPQEGICQCELLCLCI